MTVVRFTFERMPERRRRRGERLGLQAGSPQLDRRTAGPLVGSAEEWRFAKWGRLLVIRVKRFDLLAKRRVSSAGILQKSLARTRSELHRRMIQLLDFSPLLRGHLALTLRLPVRVYHRDVDAVCEVVS
jgi:hypothetical protein